MKKKSKAKPKKTIKKTTVAVVKSKATKPVKKTVKRKSPKKVSMLVKETMAENPAQNRFAKERAVLLKQLGREPLR